MRQSRDVSEFVYALSRADLVRTRTIVAAV